MGTEGGRLQLGVASLISTGEVFVGLGTLGKKEGREETPGIWRPARMDQGNRLKCTQGNTRTPLAGKEESTPAREKWVPVLPGLLDPKRWNRRSSHGLQQGPVRRTDPGLCNVLTQKAACHWHSTQRSRRNRH